MDSSILYTNPVTECNKGKGREEECFAQYYSKVVCDAKRCIMKEEEEEEEEEEEVEINRIIIMRCI